MRSRRRAGKAGSAADCHSESSCSQSWMALNKNIVMCAVEKELSNNNDGEKQAAADARRAPGETARIGIWNPATCLSRFETSSSAYSSRWPRSSEDANLLHLTGGIWRTRVPSPPRSCWPESSTARGGSTAEGAPRSVESNSSMLCQLLGFDSPPSHDPPPSRETRDHSQASSSRQRGWTAAGGVEPSAAQPRSHPPPSHFSWLGSDVTSSQLLDAATQHGRLEGFSEKKTADAGSAQLTRSRVFR